MKRGKDGPSPWSKHIDDEATFLLQTFAPANAVHLRSRVVRRIGRRMEFFGGHSD